MDFYQNIQKVYGGGGGGGLEWILILYYGS